jgi:hypothetical protein
MQIAFMTDQTAPEVIYPFRMWWGLAFCAAFLALVMVFGMSSDGSTFPVDKGDMWYYWQLSNPDVWTRLSAWVPYALHQIGMWYLIAKAQQVRPKYIFGLHSFNVYAMALNVFFMLFHVVQTRFFYDGLAQDVHEASSMMSVILMLLLILLMENNRRGLFFGYKVKPLFSIGDTVKRYHGYYFSWAIIYTFWYHPVELTSGHFAGFAYMSLLLLQSSLFFTNFHINRWWTVGLETLFAIHGALVAYFIMQQSQGLNAAGMFLFGGMATFMVCQMHGLGLSLRGKLFIVLPMIASIVVFYSFFPEGLANVARTPAIMFAGTFIMAAIVWVLMKSASLVNWLGGSSGGPAHSTS